MIEPVKEPVEEPIEEPVLEKVESPELDFEDMSQLSCF